MMMSSMILRKIYLEPLFKLLKSVLLMLRVKGIQNMLIS